SCGSQSRLRFRTKKIRSNRLSQEVHVMGLFTKSPVPVAPKPIAPAEAAAIASPPAVATGANVPAPTVAVSHAQRTSIVQPPPPTERQLYFQQLKVRIHQQLVERLDVQNLRTL